LTDVPVPAEKQFPWHFFKRKCYEWIMKYMPCVSFNNLENCTFYISVKMVDHRISFHGKA
jgi:hypothetical protein